MTNHRRSRSSLMLCASLACVGACRQQQVPELESREQRKTAEQPQKPQTLTLDQGTLEQAYKAARKEGRLEIYGNSHGHTGKGQHAASDPSDVRADIRDVVVAQMYFHAQHRRYAADLTELGFKPRRGVVVEVDGQDSTGSAVLARSAAGSECALIIGTVPNPPPYVLGPSKIFCKGKTRGPS